MKAELKKLDDFIENLTKGKDLKGNQIQGVSKKEYQNLKIFITFMVTKINSIMPLINWLMIIY